MIRRIALVTHAADGGVWSVTRFLRDVLHRSGRYESDIILLATSAHDSASVRILAPGTWLHGTRVLNDNQGSVSYLRVGAFLTELEFQRYRPRHILSELLNQFDLVQVVAGGPAWGFVTKGIRRPVALQIATLAKVERTALVRKKGVLGIWYQFMTKIATVLERHVVHNADVIFVENKWMYELLSKEVGPKKTIFAPPGIDTNYWKPGIYQPDGYILSVSRLSDPRKNVRLLIKSYHFLRQVLPKAPRLTLAGQASLLPEDWAYVASLGLTDYIKVYAEVSPEKLRAMYQNASLFVLSSDEEGLGLVILEAMASGLPVVSTDCGGPSTAVLDGETGFLTPVGDAHALAVAMQRLLENVELRQQMGRAGREVTEKRFSFDAAGKVFLDKYDELLNRKTS